jgi:hypothetical protein
MVLRSVLQGEHPGHPERNPTMTARPVPQAGDTAPKIDAAHRRGVKEQVSEVVDSIRRLIEST